MPETDHDEPTPDGSDEDDRHHPQEDFQTRGADGRQRRGAQSPAFATRPETASVRPDLRSLFHPQPCGALARPDAADAARRAEEGRHAGEETPATFDIATREQTVISGLLAVYASIREEVRSYRGLLFSNLVLAFTIPLSALAAQPRDIFRQPLWVFQRPQGWLFSLWAIGVFVMMGGVLRIMPNLMTGSERLAVIRAKQAAEALKDGSTDDAVDSLWEAIEKEDKRLRHTGQSRLLFVVTFFLFLLCVALEFALVLFSTLKDGAH